MSWRNVRTIVVGGMIGILGVSFVSNAFAATTNLGNCVSVDWQAVMGGGSAKLRVVGSVVTTHTDTTVDGVDVYVDDLREWRITEQTGLEQQNPPNGLSWDYDSTSTSRYNDPPTTLPVSTQGFGKDPNNNDWQDLSGTETWTIEPDV
jgi:hypothetical protein